MHQMTSLTVSSPSLSLTPCPLLTHQMLEFLKDPVSFLFSPWSQFLSTIDNLIISRSLYSDLTCPNWYSKLILQLPKLGSQGHLKFNTSKRDLPDALKILASAFSISITVSSFHLRVVFKLEITSVWFFGAASCTHFPILQEYSSALASLLTNPFSHFSIHLHYVSTRRTLSFYHQ